MGDDLAVVHRHQPVEALRLVHIGGGDRHARLRATGADGVDEVPELAARQQVDAGGRLVEDQQIRIVDQRTAKAELLLHAAGELAGRPVFEWIERGGSQEFAFSWRDARLPTGRTAGQKVDVLEHAERWERLRPKPCGI